MRRISPFLRRFGVLWAVPVMAALAGCGPSPDAADPPVRFMALGDVGSGGPAQREVAAQMARTYREWGADFVLFLGDNFYPAGVDTAEDPIWHSHFESVYDPAGLPLPVYAVAGNHDRKGNADAQIDYARRSARWRMPDHHYRFRREAQGHSVEFVAVDLMIIDEPFDGHADGLAWLEAVLSASDADHKIVFGHFAIWASPGRYGDNAELAARFAPVLQRHGVDLYLAGHEHHLEIQAPRAGLVQAISGAGSQSRDVVPGPMTRFASGRLGFMWFSVGREGLAVRVVSRDGLVLFDGPLPDA